MASAPKCPAVGVPRSSLGRAGVCLLFGAALACSPEPPTNVTATFASSFEEVGRVVLEERVDQPIVGVTWLGRRPAGGFLVVDEVGAQVHLFDEAGRLERVLGGPGDGPGELDAPTAAVELQDGRVFVTQRANRRLTVYAPDGTPTLSSTPGRYGRWLHDLDGRLLIGVGSREDRFVVASYGGDSLRSFGALPPEVNEIPFWIYYARESAAVVGGRIAINTSFYPTIRLFTEEGDSVGTLGEAPADWIQAGSPPVDRARTPEAQHAVREWSTGFSIVTALAGLDAGQIVVQYGRFSPSNQDLYRVEPTAISVYSLSGERLAEGLAVEHRLVAGGPELVLLVGQPPEPWMIARHRWRGSG